MRCPIRQQAGGATLTHCRLLLATLAWQQEVERGALDIGTPRHRTGDWLPLSPGVDTREASHYNDAESVRMNIMTGHDPQIIEQAASTR